MEHLKYETEAMKNETIEARRYLHKNAECGFDLPKTKEFIKKKLIEYGLSPTELGCASILASINKGKDKTLLLRADIDAVPIKEETDLFYRSERDAMHACGHDMHTAILLSVAKLLKRNEGGLNCNIKFLFQGAEELLMGANDCLENGLLTSEPVPDMAIGMHVLTGLPIESCSLIIPQAGVVAPSCDFFTINIKGESSHAGIGISKDALYVLGELITTLPQLPRFISTPASQSLISIGMAHGGTATNITAESGTLYGSVRSFDEETQKKLKDRIIHHAKSISEAYMTESEIKFEGKASPLKNDGKLTQRIKSILKGDKTVRIRRAEPCFQDR